jgi:drug/metabolite transporter (DMT)-like permease
LTIEVMLAVLLGALLHSAWNAMIRSSSDRALDMVLVVTGATVITGCLLPFSSLPATASWPYLIASGVIHVVYFTLVALSYRHGELSFAYPIMRGSAPVLSAIAAALLLAEWPSAGGWLGVLLICGGVMLLAADSWRNGQLNRQATLFALATAGTIVIYTLVDGVGARLSGNPAVYTGWVFVLTAVPLLALFSKVHGRRTATYLHRHWKRGLVGGACTLASYALSLWAITQAPIALVAALRETSVVFGAVIAATLLREPVSRNRWLAILVVVAGAIAIKMA